MPENIIAAEIEPLSNQVEQSALRLQELGFQVLDVGLTISVQAPQSLWESFFKVSFETQEQPSVEPGVPSRSFQRAITDNLQIPETLQSSISNVFFVEPPRWF